MHQSTGIDNNRRAFIHAHLCASEGEQE